MPQFYWRHWVGLSAVPLVLIVGNLNFSVSTTGIQPSIGAIAQAESSVQSSIPSPQELIEAHNLIRANPKLLIPVLQEMKSSFDPQNPKLIRFKGMEVNAGNGKKLKFSPITAMTVEGVAAIDDALNDLNRQSQKTFLPFQLSLEISQASLDHSNYLAYQAKSGETGHDVGPEGRKAPDARVSKYGVHGEVGENIAYIGYSSPRDLTAADVVLLWIIDDGVPSRGHRQDVFTNRQLMGAACVLSTPKKKVFCTSNTTPWFVPLTRSAPFNPEIGDEVVFNLNGTFHRGKVDSKERDWFFVEGDDYGRKGYELLSLKEAEQVLTEAQRAGLNIVQEKH
jgi:hypothetical protein